MFNPIHKATKHIDRGKKNHISPAINTEMRVGKAFLKKSVVMVTNEDNQVMMTCFQSAFAFSSPLT